MFASVKFYKMHVLFIKTFFSTQLAIANNSYQTHLHSIRGIGLQGVKNNFRKKG